ncbi:MAG: hypothetical protein AABY64_12855 [Bdellovibrionota bacterium]
MKKYLVFISIGFELIALVLFGIYIADILEKKFETKGLITMGLIFAILAGWFLHITYLLKKINKNGKNGS